MEDILQRANDVKEELACFRAVEKAIQELNKIKDGQLTLTLHYLKLNDEQLDRALIKADKDLQESYDSLKEKLA